MHSTHYIQKALSASLCSFTYLSQLDNWTTWLQSTYLYSVFVGLSEENILEIFWGNERALKWIHWDNLERTEEG